MRYQTLCYVLEIEKRGKQDLQHSSLTPCESQHSFSITYNCRRSSWFSLLHSVVLKPSAAQET